MQIWEISTWEIVFGSWVYCNLGNYYLRNCFEIGNLGNYHLRDCLWKLEISVMQIWEITTCEIVFGNRKLVYWKFGNCLTVRCCSGRRSFFYPVLPSYRRRISFLDLVHLRNIYQINIPWKTRVSPPHTNSWI